MSISIWRFGASHTALPTSLTVALTVALAALTVPRMGSPFAQASTGGRAPAGRAATPSLHALLRRVRPGVLAGLVGMVGGLLGMSGVACAAAVEVGAAAPDFTLRSLPGPNLRLQEQRGKVVLVNFWASWCGPCRQEMPHLNRLADKYKSAGLVVLGVNVDAEPGKASDAASRWAVAFPVLLDTGMRVSKLYDLNAMPSTVLVDRDGRVRFVHRGYQSGYETQYEQQLRELLKE